MPTVYSPDVSEPTSHAILEKRSGKYIIIRQDTKAYALKDIKIDKDNLLLLGKLSFIDLDHFQYLSAKREKYRYNAEQTSVLNEVHLYISDSYVIDTSFNLSLPLDKIIKIEVIEKDANKTVSQTLLTTLGIGAGAIVVLSAIVVLAKSSCPFISVSDNGVYKLQGELYGGAVTKNLERDDYLKLNVSLTEPQLKIKIHNELKENQYVNLTDLLIAEHPDSLTVYPDPIGRLHTLGNLINPVSAVLNEKMDVKISVSDEDQVFSHFDDTTDVRGINNLDISFPQSAQATKANLFLLLKNSYWFDFLYGEFMSGFGRRFDKWKRGQKNIPTEKMNAWSDSQHIPLEISVQTPSGWQKVTSLKTIGPLTTRGFVIPIDVSEAKGDLLHVRLSSGFMFWDIDKVGIDYTPDVPLKTSVIKPIRATDNKGQSVLAVIAKDDDEYLSQPIVGDWAELEYPNIGLPAIGKSLSYILHSKGYYVPIRKFSGHPDVAFLSQFRRPGFMSVYSRNKYLIQLRKLDENVFK